MIITEKDVRLKTARSSGPGGSNANRRATKVQIWVRVGDLPVSDIQKKQLRAKLAHRINHDDEIEVVREDDRSQDLNKENAIAEMNQLIAEALHNPLPRISTSVTKGENIKRVMAKKVHGRKKEDRSKVKRVVVEE